MALRPSFLPAIRSMQEARDALAEVLEIQVRRMQIIIVMQKIMFCRTRDTRKFLGDAMAGLLEGGLDYMRRKRREAIEAMQRTETARRTRTVVPPPAPAAPARDEQKELQGKIRAAMKVKRAPARRDAFVFETVETTDHDRIAMLEPLPEEGIGVTIPAEKPAPAAAPAAAAEPEVSSMLASPEEMKEIEDLGTELDALSLAAVAREIFPDLKTMYEPWEVGRAIYMDEKAAREAVLQGARLKDQERATMLAPAFDDMKRLIENRRPSWSGSLQAIRECIDAHFGAEAPRPTGATAQHVFDAIVMSDRRALEMLKLAGKSRDQAVEYAGGIRRKLEKLMTIDEQSEG